MRRIARPPLSLLLLVAAAVGCKDRAAPARDDTPPAALPDLSSSLDALRAEFNAHRGESRFLTLLSPTWGKCINGARAVRASILENPGAAGLRPIVVWIPMLGPDGPDAAQRASERFRDRAVPQFWDGSRLAGKEVSRSIGERTRVAWDIYLFYGPEAEWTEIGLPPPDAALAQVGLADGSGVVASPGALPATGDQSRLPPFLRGRAVIAGDPADLPALLAQVASRYVTPESAR